MKVDLPIPPFWLANEIEIGSLLIVLFFLSSVMFPYIQPIRRYDDRPIRRYDVSSGTSIRCFTRYVDTAVDRSEHGTNKRVKTAERYPDGHERT